MPKDDDRLTIWADVRSLEANLWGELQAVDPLKMTKKEMQSLQTRIAGAVAVLQKNRGKWVVTDSPEEAQR